MASSPDQWECFDQTNKLYNYWIIWKILGALAGSLGATVWVEKIDTGWVEMIELTWLSADW